MNTFENLKRVGAHVYSHKLLFSVSIILDLLFFYILTRLHLEVFQLIGERVVQVSQLIEQQTAELTASALQASGGSLDSYLVSLPSFTALYKEILYYMIIFFGGVFLAWVILGGISWLLSHKIAGTYSVVCKVRSKKQSSQFHLLSSTLHTPPSTFYPPLIFLLHFAWHTLVFGLLFILWVVFFVYVTDTGALLPLFDETISSVLIGLGTIVIGYAMILTYCFGSIKKAIIRLHKERTVMISYLIYLLFLAGCLLLGTWLFTVHWLLLLALVLGIILPSMTLFRVWCIRLIFRN